MPGYSNYAATPQTKKNESSPQKKWHPAEFYFWRQQQGHAMTPRIGPPGWGTMPAMPVSGQGMRANYPDPGQPPAPGYDPNHYGYARRPAAGSPPAPPYGYAQRPDDGSPPAPPETYGYAQRPEPGSYPPSPLHFPPEQSPQLGPTPDRSYVPSPYPLYKSSGLAGAVAGAAKRGRYLVDWSVARGGVANSAQAEYNARLQAQRDRISEMNEPRSSPQELARRGAALQGQYRPQTPWANNSAYGNVQLPPTEYGPNQSVPQVRDRIADRFDPSSWAVSTRTPGEINQQIGQRTAGHLQRLRQSGFDPLLARGGYQRSPVNAEGIVGLPSAADERAQRDAAARQRFDQSMARQRADLEARAQANKISVDEQKRLDSTQRTEGAKYTNYVRNSTRVGERPMSYGEWVAAGGSNNQESRALEQQAFRERSERLAQRDAEREANRGAPNYQRAMFMSRYGVPMQMPNDPMVAQNWMQSMAMAGNPMAAGAYGQAVSQQGENLRNAQDNATRAAGYQSQLEANKYTADRQLDIARERNKSEVSPMDEKKMRDQEYVRSYLGEAINRARSAGGGQVDVERAEREALNDLKRQGYALTPEQEARVGGRPPSYPQGAGFGQPGASPSAPAPAAPPASGDGQQQTASVADPEVRDNISRATPMNEDSFDALSALGSSLASSGVTAPTREQLIEVSRGSALGNALSNKSKMSEMLQEYLRKQDAYSREHYDKNRTWSDAFRSYDPIYGLNPVQAWGDMSSTYQQGRKAFDDQNAATLNIFRAILGDEAVENARKSYYRKQWVN